MAKPMPQLEVEERIRVAHHVALFLDFDGTLAPLVPDPVGARMDEAVRQALGSISRGGRAVVSIISGRALDHLRERVGLPDLIYAGNHGLEIEGRGLSFVEPAAAAARGELRAVARRLESALRAIPGAFVEYKVLTTSVHYRNVDAGDRGRVEQAVLEAIAPAAGLFRLGTGKMLWEILPKTDWNKGAAVRWILDRVGGDGMVSIYFGDDRTDEDAFRALPDGLTFKVGRAEPTDARYRVSGPAAVEEFLEWLACQ
jgi:trehalose 6-phosphate phosphatase